MIGIVLQHNHPIYTLDMFRKIFNVGDQQQIILLTNKLNGISIKERGDINTYLTKAMDIKNQLKVYKCLTCNGFTIPCRSPQH